MLNIKSLAITKWESNGCFQCAMLYKCPVRCKDRFTRQPDGVTVLPSVLPSLVHNSFRSRPEPWTKIEHIFAEQFRVAGVAAMLKTEQNFFLSLSLSLCLPTFLAWDWYSVFLPWRHLAPDRALRMLFTPLPVSNNSFVWRVVIKNQNRLIFKI